MASNRRGDTVFRQSLRGIMGALAALAVLYLVGALFLLFGAESLPVEAIILAIFAALLTGAVVISKLRGNARRL